MRTGREGAADAPVPSFPAGLASLIILLTTCAYLAKITALCTGALALSFCISDGLAIFFNRSTAVTSYTLRRHSSINRVVFITVSWVQKKLTA